jgi:hypothetical protein
VTGVRTLAVAALLALALPGVAATEEKSRLQLIAPDLDTTGSAAKPQPKPAAKAAGVAAPRRLDNGALAISALWLEAEINQDAVVAGLKYKDQVLQIDGVLKEKALDGDKLKLTIVGDAKKTALRGFTCVVAEPASIRAGGALKIGQAVTMAGTVEKILDKDQSPAGTLKDCIVLTGHPDPAGAQAQVAALSGTGAAPAAAAGPKERHGVAFFVSAEGYLVTSHDMVEGCRSLTTVADGKALAVVKGDATNALALLKLPDGAPAVARFRAGTGPKLGETVRVLGFAAPGEAGADGPPDLAVGVVSAVTTGKNDTRLVQITAPAEPTIDGAPLLDESNAVIGLMITVTKDGKPVELGPNVHVAIIPELVRRFLDINDVPVATAGATPAADPARFTTRIVCKG